MHIYTNEHNFYPYQSLLIKFKYLPVCRADRCGGSWRIEGRSWWNPHWGGWRLGKTPPPAATAQEKGQQGVKKRTYPPWKWSDLYVRCLAKNCLWNCGFKTVLKSVICIISQETSWAPGQLHQVKTSNIHDVMWSSTKDLFITLKQYRRCIFKKGWEFVIGRRQQLLSAWVYVVVTRTVILIVTRCQGEQWVRRYPKTWERKENFWVIFLSVFLALRRQNNPVDRALIDTMFLPVWKTRRQQTHSKKTCLAGTVSVCAWQVCGWTLLHMPLVLPWI